MAKPIHRLERRRESSPGGAARGEARAGRIMILPALLGLVLFIGLPFVLAVAFSLTDLRIGSPHAVEFVGLRQYARLFSDEVFRRALLNNLLFGAFVVPVQTALALGLALLLHREMRGRVVFRTLFFLPVVFPLSLVAVVWILLYAPGPNGTMNAVLSALTFGAWHAKDFLRDPNWALPCVALTSVWQGTGLQMVILLAGLQAVPEHLYEVARIDGANAWRRFLHVTLPQLRNPLVFVIVVTSILSFRVFDQVRIMTQGGPDSASTTVIFEAVRSAFDRAQLARGSAMAVVFFAIVMAFTLLQRHLLRQEGTVE